MKRLTKRLAQLEAKLRYGASKFSKSQLFGIIQQILVVEEAIANQSKKQNIDYLRRLNLIHGRERRDANKLVLICQELEGRVHHLLDVEEAHPELDDRQVVLVFDALTLSKEAEAQYLKLAA